MIKSMTGFGRYRETLHGRDITVEMKSVNNRYLDCNIKLPRAFSFVEDSMKATIQKMVSRGKLDVFVTVDVSQAEETEVKINESLADGYMKALQQLADQYGLENKATNLNLALFPDVLSVSKKEDDLDEITADFVAVTEKAVNAFNQMRLTEGEKLAADVLKKADTIEELVKKVEERSPQTVVEYREKLLARMKEVLASTTIDEARIVTEAAIFADKVAVDEETVRLHSHLNQLRSMLKGNEPVGRKLDFLIQEVNRECNTIGSKCNDLTITQWVVDLKSEVEKVREQIQNME